MTGGTGVGLSDAEGGCEFTGGRTELTGGVAMTGVLEDEVVSDRLGIPAPAAVVSLVLDWLVGMPGLLLVVIVVVLFGFFFVVVGDCFVGMTDLTVVVVVDELFDFVLEAAFVVLVSPGSPQMPCTHERPF